jgi:hypothetical protein
MKVYVMNWCGKTERMVAAKSKKSAREVLVVSEYSSRELLHDTVNKTDIAVAMGKPGAVFEKPYNPSNCQWTELPNRETTTE